MKFTATVDLKIDTAGLLRAVEGAARSGMRDVVVQIAAEAVQKVFALDNAGEDDDDGAE